eukprot:GILJ01003486.1.p1 GENE.GILJ01003486.1~~GILJ01003486.1.p1  ORF type:complete len:623 (-),score=78.67 GILJ01003486.1:153-2000(-)
MRWLLLAAHLLLVSAVNIAEHKSVLRHRALTRTVFPERVKNFIVQKKPLTQEELQGVLQDIRKAKTGQQEEVKIEEAVGNLGIVGAGPAGLATAYWAIVHSKVPADKIYIFEKETNFHHDHLVRLVFDETSLWEVIRQVGELLSKTFGVPIIKNDDTKLWEALKVHKESKNYVAPLHRFQSAILVALLIKDLPLDRFRSSAHVQHFNRANGKLTIASVEYGVRFGFVVNAAGAVFSRNNPFLKPSADVTDAEPRYVQHPAATLKGNDNPIPREFDLPVVGVGFIFTKAGCEKWLDLLPYMDGAWAASNVYYGGKATLEIARTTESCHAEFVHLLSGFYWPFHVVRHLSHVSGDHKATSREKIMWLKRIEFLKAVFPNVDKITVAQKKRDALAKLESLLEPDSLLSLRLYTKQARVVARDTGGSDKADQSLFFLSGADESEGPTNWQMVPYDSDVALVGDSLRDADPLKGKGAADAGFLALAFAKCISYDTERHQIVFSQVSENYMRFGSSKDAATYLNAEGTLLSLFAGTARDELTDIVNELFIERQITSELTLTSITGVTLCPEIPSDQDIANTAKAKEIRAEFLFSVYGENPTKSAITSQKQICDAYRAKLNP